MIVRDHYSIQHIDRIKNLTATYGRKGLFWLTVPGYCLLWHEYSDIHDTKVTVAIAWVAGHIVSSVRRQRGTNIGDWLAFSFLCSLALQPIFRVGLPTSVNLINQDNPSPAWPKVYLFGDFSPVTFTISHHSCIWRSTATTMHVSLRPSPS